MTDMKTKLGGDVSVEIALGGGAYVEISQGCVRIFTSNGVEDTNEVFLEPDTMDKLVKWWVEVTNEVGE